MKYVIKDKILNSSDIGLSFERYQTIEVVSEFQIVDAEKIKARSQDLTEASMKLGEAIYKTESEKSAEETGEEATDVEKDGDIVDADFEDLDEEKNK